MTDDRPLWERTAHFVNRETGVMSRVAKVDASFAYIEVLAPLPSSWAMPVADYDARWARRYVPIDMGQMKVPDKYRPPADTGVWRDPSLLEAADGARGETPDGVRIG